MSVDERYSRSYLALRDASRLVVARWEAIRSAEANGLPAPLVIEQATGVDVAGIDAAIRALEVELRQRASV